MAFQWEINQIWFFGLVFLRLLAFIFSMVFFSSSQVPMTVKIFFSLVTAFFVVTYFVNKSIPPILEGDLIPLAVTQVAIGLVMGLTTQFIMWSLQITADWVGISSGLSSAQVFNPLYGSQSSVLAGFYNTLVGFIFFSLGVHSFFIRSLIETFQVIPISAGAALSTMDLSFGISFFILVIENGVRLGLPVMGAVFLANLAMGILARVVPQLNIFVTSLQLTFLITLAVLFLSGPWLIQELVSLVEQGSLVVRAWK